MADRAGWQRAVESELRAVGRDLAVPPAGDLTAAVRRRLEGRAARRRRVPALGTGALRRQLRWRAVLVVVAALLAVLIATPQGRAAIIQVLRFAGVELRQEPGPPLSPVRGGSLPGERRMSLEQARRQVSFPILIPAALGRPGDVVVSDGGRVVSLIYRRTSYGLVRMDEFAGHLDQVYFQKIIDFRNVTYVEVNGTKGLWIRGPHELVYITRDGYSAAASARLTTGNTLIWGTRQVALRLEGNLGKTTALAIASSAH
ncbi:MAG TPA: hypothetical protein VGS19_23630 [Streptosporangiaceae bacterium]|nr:hypothetical protein [Streptosporangiaceae bacterium]